MPAGRENVGEKGKGGFVRNTGRKKKGVEVGEWNAKVLRLDGCMQSLNLSLVYEGKPQQDTNLPTGIWSHGNIAVCSTSEARVDAGAECCIAHFAIRAPSICYVERKNHSIALLE